MKFRKKPIVVDAQQWFPPGDPRHDPKMLTIRKGNSVSTPDYRQKGDIYPFTTIKGMGADNIYFIRTGGPNDNVEVHPGDWIITGIKGEKYPCNPDIFAATYEQADQPSELEDENKELVIAAHSLLRAGEFAKWSDDISEANWGVSALAARTLIENSTYAKSIYAKVGKPENAV